MFYRLRTTWNKRRFDRLTRRILDTPPIHTVNADWSIISMVSNSDVQMYILSIKSFYARIGRGEVIVILDCANNNRAFTLNQNHHKIQTMREYATNAQSLDVKYVGIHVEKMFARYPNCDRLRYVRGSSGLAGFSLGGFAPNKLEEFHEAMRRLLGDNTWRKWGTEQCASNFAIANSPDALVLPYPKYANFD